MQIVDKNITHAETLSKEFYLSNSIFNTAKEKIFAPSWQLITHSTLFGEVNVYPFTFLSDHLDEPLLITKNGEDFHCFSNVCTHRAHLVETQSCKTKKLRCRYHGRTFSLDGKFNSMPGFAKAENFPSPSDNLTRVPLMKWKDFIFVSLDKGIDITPVLKDIEKRIPNFPFSELIYNESSSDEWIIDAHWALYCENYLEGFHVPFVHKGLAKELNLESYETIILENGTLQIGEGRENIPILKNPESPNKNIYGLYYWIFPNLMLNFYKWGLSVNIVEPISSGQTRIRFLSFPMKSQTQPKAGGASLGKVELEDQAVVLNVQKGIKSRFYNMGRFSPEHETGVHYFQGLLAETLNASVCS